MDIDTIYIERLNTPLKRHFTAFHTRMTAIALVQVTDGYKEFWPMTARAYYYKLVSMEVIENNKKAYDVVTSALAKMRRLGYIPWEAVEDKARHTLQNTDGFNTTIKERIEHGLNGMMERQYYYREIAGTQDVYCEITIEKDALAGVVERATDGFYCHVTTTKGNLSATFVKDMAERFKAAQQKGLKTKLLHFGDFDPTGEQIPLSIQSKMLKWHDVKVDVEIVGLTKAQADKYNLPQNTKIKPKDSNAAKFIAKYGIEQAPVELDGLHPDTITQIVKETLEEFYDMDKFEIERKKERKGQKKLDKKWRKITRKIKKQFPEYFTE